MRVQPEPENLPAEPYSPVDSELVAAVLRKDRNRITALRITPLAKKPLAKAS